MLTKDQRLTIFELYTQGTIKPQDLTLALYGKDLPAGAFSEVMSYIEGDEFNQVRLEAQRDYVSMAVDYVKRRLLTYTGRMDKLAMQESDKRTAFQALKDLLDRGGTGAIQKIALQSPKAYADSVAGLVAEDGEEDIPIGGTDPD